MVSLVQTAQSLKNWTRSTVLRSTIHPTNMDYAAAGDKAEPNDFTGNLHWTMLEQMLARNCWPELPTPREFAHNPTLRSNRAALKSGPL
jgi:hypothetical protein